MNMELDELVKRILDAVNAAFVDFDGVIADTEPLHARSYVKLLQEQGIDFAIPDFSRYMGRPALEILGAMETDFGIRFDKPNAVRRRTDHFLTLVSSQDLQPNQPVVNVLRYLNGQGKSVAILSSQRRAVITTLLGRWQLEDYITEIYTTHDDVTTKQEALERADELLGEEASRVVAIEDSKEMLNAAHVLNMKTIGVVHTLNKMANLQADTLIHVSGM